MVSVLQEFSLVSAPFAVVSVASVPGQARSLAPEYSRVVSTRYHKYTKESVWGGIVQLRRVFLWGGHLLVLRDYFVG